MDPKILREAFDRLKRIEESSNSIEIVYVKAKHPKMWMNVPGIEPGDEADSDDGSIDFTITKLTKKIINGIKSQELVLDIEFMDEAAITFLIKAGVSTVNDVNIGIVDITDYAYNDSDDGSDSEPDFGTILDQSMTAAFTRLSDETGNNRTALQAMKQWIKRQEHNDVPTYESRLRKRT